MIGTLILIAIYALGMVLGAGGTWYCVHEYQAVESSLKSGWIPVIIFCLAGTLLYTIAIGLMIAVYLHLIG